MALLAALLGASLVSGCTSAADVRAAQEAAIAEREADADALYAALLATANERELPIAREDASRRRITSEYVDEGAEVRRRYFLSVATTRSGMALRVNIVREEREPDAVVVDGGAEGDAEGWRELPRNAEVEAEEMAIVQAAYERWDGSR